MRNLVQYPVEEKDVENFLKDNIERQKEYIGSPEPYIAHKLTQFFRENPDILTEFLDFCKV